MGTNECPPDGVSSRRRVPNGSRSEACQRRHERCQTNRDQMARTLRATAMAAWDFDETRNRPARRRDVPRGFRIGHRRGQDSPRCDCEPGAARHMARPSRVRQDVIVTVAQVGIPPHRSPPATIWSVMNSRCRDPLAGLRDPFLSTPRLASSPTDSSRSP